MKTYLRLLAFSKPYSSYIPVYGLFTLGYIVFNTLNISFVAPILNILFLEDSKNLEIVTLPDFSLSIDYFKTLISYGKYMLLSGGSKEESLKLVCMVLVGSVFFSNLFNFFGSFVLAGVKGKVIYNIRTQVYSKLIRMHTSYFTNERRGDIISRMTNDVQEVESSVIMSMSVMLKEPLTIIFVFMVLFSISAHLTIFTLIVLPLSGAVIGEITRRLRKSAKLGQGFLGAILSDIDETIGGMKIIQAFTAEEKMNAKFEDVNQDYRKTLKSIDVKRSMASPISQFMGIGVVAFIIYYGGNLVFAESLSPDVFIAFIMLFASIISPIKSISNTVSVIQRGLIAGERIFEVLDKEELIKNADNSIAVDEFKTELKFSKVGFKYGENEVLKNINLSITKGKSVALVGPSGGGKSTLADLIPRFYDVANGEISIDGNNIKDIEIQSLRKLMGIVTQESILFNDSVFNNIAFGMPNASKEEVIEAAKVANAHEFISQMEEGYESKIGDRGVKLSGGQRQRISIARAVLKNPAILILDEATSALDSESEKLVQEALNKLMKNRTSVVIAHRLSTIQNADEIVVLKEGQIIETGFHQELYSQKGFYYNLCKTQIEA